MPYRLIWEANPSGLLATYSGRISADDLAAFYREITVDPRWDYLRYVIVDASAVDGVDVDSSSGAMLVRRNVLIIGAARSRDPLPFVFVANNPELLNLLQRQRELRAFPYATPVFESVAAAREWLADAHIE